MWAGLIQLIQLVEGLKRKKTTIHQPLSKREFTTRLPLDLSATLAFPAWWPLNLHTGSLLGSPVCLPTCKLDLKSLHNHMNQLLIICLLLLLFLWRVLTNTDAKVLAVWWARGEGCLSHLFLFSWHSHSHCHMLPYKLTFTLLPNLAWNSQS